MKIDKNISKALEKIECGDYATAKALFNTRLKKLKNDFISIFYLGVISVKTNKLVDALAQFGNALKIFPKYTPALFNRGLVLEKLGRYQEALEHFDKTLSIDPSNEPAILSKCSVLLYIGRKDLALDNFNKFLIANPGNASVLLHKGVILDAQERDEEATVVFQDVLHIAPNLDTYTLGYLCFSMLKCCNWGQFDTLSSQIKEKVLSGLKACQPLALLSICDDLAVLKRCAQTYSSERYPAKEKLWRGEKYSHQYIRIAYVSPDFREHPVGHLTAGIFENHDRDKFETIAISLGVDDQSSLRSRLIASFDHFIDMRMRSPRDIAELIRSMEVDIVIDLAGYTAGCCTEIFSYRPAPLQVNFLGFPCTMGVEFIDYIIGDHVVTPSTDQPHYSEKVVYMPDTYLPTDSNLKVAENSYRAEYGLTENEIVFCSFNHSHKIKPDIFEVWMRILKRTPNSVLWLMKLNGVAEENLCREAEARGVAPKRLIFASRVPNVEDHLARYRLADLFLDTVPYNAHTTASDALFVGLPVLTCLGKAFPGRVASSLLHAIGMPELIAGTLAEYEELAVELAADKDKLLGIKQKLRRNRDTFPLFDTVRFCRHLESAFHAMWRRSQEGEAPASFEVTRIGETYAPTAKEPVNGPNTVLPAPVELVDAQEEMLHTGGKVRSECWEVIDSIPSPCVPDYLETLREKVESFPYWYHRIELPGGLVTPGWAPLSPTHYRVPESLEGLRVLDVGAWDGYWTFEALKRGAKEVVAIDDFTDFLGSLENKDRRAWETFDLCKNALGYDDNSCKRIDMSVYDVSLEALGSFDVVFCFGTLYHLRHPLLALDKLSAICNGRIFVESAILDDYSPYQGGIGHGYKSNVGHTLMEFYPGDEYGNNYSNWWVPTLVCMAKMVSSAGFSEVQMHKLVQGDAQQLALCRGFVSGAKR